MSNAVATSLALPLLLAGGATLAWAWGCGDIAAPGEARLLSLCIMFCWALLLLAAICDRAQARTLHYGVVAAMTGAAGCLVALWMPLRGAFDASLVHAACGLGVLTFAASGLARGTHALGFAWPTSWFTVLLAGVCCALAPLWLGPLLEKAVVANGVIDTVVAISPVSYLASLLEWDYLRGDWFYRHTPFGSLRYAYPDGVTSSVFYLAAGLSGHLSADHAGPFARLIGIRHPVAT
ncbi:MAG: hypothetical protein H6954_08580 [Chromatiaceae bacterium]|nr:hypothetical protein [Chromatiaceae bacterium]